MPELPEVETTRRGIEPWLNGYSVEGITVRNPNLRWPVDLPDVLLGQRILSVQRRAKYLILQFAQGCILGHLGMSGSLRVLDPGEPIKKHDHLDILFSSHKVLRYNDPRRFGSWQFYAAEPNSHWLLKDLGIEPLSNSFSGKFLHKMSRSKAQVVKSFIMDAKVVVGVGNIYANEALFLAGIRPSVRSSRLSLRAYENLALAIKTLLERAIKTGGTTLRDFTNANGEPGYFQQTLRVYGREGKPCKNCGKTLKKMVISQRSSFYCTYCQGTKSINVRPIN